MKPHFLAITVAAGWLLAATTNLRALPPRQCSISDVVEAINYDSHTIGLNPKEGAAPLTSVWNDGTYFPREGGCCKKRPDAGEVVGLSYRREPGQNVQRQVIVKDSGLGCPKQ